MAKRDTRTPDFAAMKGSRKGVGVKLGLLAVLVAVFALLVTGRVPDEWLKPIRASLPGASMHSRDEGPAEVREPAVDAKLEAAALVPVPDSPWREASRKRYTALLAQAKPDVVVLPFQIPPEKKRSGIDASARSIMAYMTAERISGGGRVNVAEVELVARALDEPRYLKREEAAAFARSIGAREFVYAQVFRDERERMSVKLSRTAVGPNGATTSANADGIQLSDVATPELAFRGVAGDLVRRVGYEPVLDAKAYSVGASYFPESPAGATARDPSNPVEGIWIQQLIATLHGPSASAEKSRVYERIVAALESVSPDSPDYRLLLARALARLNRRPAALAVLGPARTPEEQALIDYLNANVPELTASVAKIARPLPKLIAQIELLWLRRSFYFDAAETQEPAEDLARSVPKEWQPVVAWHVLMQSAWLVRGTADMKLVMDAHFPLKGFSADEILRGKAVAGSPNDARVALEVESMAMQHAQKVLEHTGAAWCCTSGAWKPRPFQYLDLLNGLAESMLVHTVGRSHHVHGNDERALAMSDLLNQHVFQGGQLALQYETMRIIDDLIKKERSPEKKSALVDRLYFTAKQARQWDTRDAGAIVDAVAGERLADQLRARASGPRGYPDLNDLKYDFPPTYEVLRKSAPYKAALRRAGDVDIFRRTCTYAHEWASACFALRTAYEALGRKEDMLRTERQELLQRFRGSPWVLDRMTTLLERQGDVAGARALAKQMIDVAPQAWRGYQELAFLDLQRAENAAAQKTLIAYPPFQNAAGNNTVRISNNANWAANAFARRGAGAEARRFYEIAARYENGSAASYSAAKRLAFMDRRFGDAEKITLRAVQHYPEGFTEEYVALMFALGESQNGWAAAREAMTRYSTFGPWFAVPVGFRVDGADAQAVRGWAREAARLPSRTTGESNPTALYALTIASHALAVDRGADSIAALGAVRADIFGKAAESLDAAAAQRHQAPASHLEALDRFIAGYGAHKRGDFEAAWQAFQNWPMGGYGDPACSVVLTSLPYFAYAAVKTGRAREFGPYLDMLANNVNYFSLEELPTMFPPYSFYLSRAILAAAAGDHERAAKQLVLARGFGQVRAEHPLPPPYLLAEVSELIYGMTGRREYLDGALKVAKSFQSLEPWAAWAYAFEAKYGNDPADRAKAYAIGRHLDRRSAWLAGVEPATAKAADQWLARNKPFPRESGGTPGKVL